MNNSNSSGSLLHDCSWIGSCFSLIDNHGQQLSAGHLNQDTNGSDYSSVRDNAN